MRVLIINPNSDQETADVLSKTAQSFLEDRGELDVVSMRTAPKLVVTYEDQAASAMELIATVRAGRERYDAFILACHADPNLDLVREVAGGKPVFGIAEASMRMAAMLHGGYAVITPSEKIIPKKFALARKYHCEEELRTVVVSGGNEKEHLLDAGRKALQVPGVNAIVLGCANYSGLDSALEQELNVPVFDGLIWALILADGAVHNEEYQRKTLG